MVQFTIDSDLLKLELLKRLFRKTYKWNPNLRFAVLGLFVYIQERVIEARAVAAVDEAVAKYNQQFPIIPELPQPIYSEAPSQVEGLPEMRLTAPWYAKD
jgi:hypothetical protein